MTFILQNKCLSQELEYKSVWILSYKMFYGFRSISLDRVLLKLEIYSQIVQIFFNMLNISYAINIWFFSNIDDSSCTHLQNIVQ